jgi:hypothetical protein
MPVESSAAVDSAVMRQGEDTETLFEERFNVPQGAGKRLKHRGLLPVAVLSQMVLDSW